MSDRNNAIIGGAFSYTSLRVTAESKTALPDHPRPAAKAPARAQNPLQAWDSGSIWLEPSRGRDGQRIPPRTSIEQIRTDVRRERLDKYATNFVAMTFNSTCMPGWAGRLSPHRLPA
jgi:hypothetical protein